MRKRGRGEEEVRGQGVVVVKGEERRRGRGERTRVVVKGEERRGDEEEVTRSSEERLPREGHG